MNLYWQIYIFDSFLNIIFKITVENKSFIMSIARQANTNEIKIIVIHILFKWVS